MRVVRVALLAVASLFLSACGYNTLQVQDEAVKSAWPRSSTSTSAAPTSSQPRQHGEGFAAQEQAVLVGVTEARAKATQIQVNADDPESLKQFQAAQGEYRARCRA